jgi:hypothetical protein
MIDQPPNGATGRWRATAVLGGFAALTLPLMPVQAVLLRTSARGARAFPHWYHRQVCRLLGIRLAVEGRVARDCLGSKALVRTPSPLLHFGAILNSTWKVKSLNSLAS